MRNNIWVLTIGNNDPITSEQALQDLQSAQVEGKENDIRLVLSKRDYYGYVRTNIGEQWAYFDEMRTIRMKVVDLNANDKIYSRNNNDTSIKKCFTNS